MDEQRLTDTQAKKVLERASELDAQQTHSLDIATVRAIASEAGISPAAVDAALMEQVTEQATEQATERATAQPTAVAGGNAKRRLRAVARVVLGVALAYLLLSIVMRLFP